MTLPTCLLAVLLGASVRTPQDDPTATRYFRIEVVDRATGRGVPLVELRTTYRRTYVTDSAGVVAFHEPGLMGKEVWFTVEGHRYRHPADGFGNRGARLTPTAGGRATIEVDRVNVAERLYRVTGIGIYRDSVLLGEPTPLARPLVNARVSGQDSALAHVYRGRIHWFWGDTGRLSYPLGLFKTVGATSELPAEGGLPPDVGIDLHYHTGDDGFAREVAPVPGPGVVWIDGVSSARDDGGEPRMFAYFERREGLGEVYEQGLLVWNDEEDVFEQAAELALDEFRHPLGRQPFTRPVRGEEYLHFAAPWPVLRVPRRLSAVLDPTRYEAYTPLAPGARFEGADTRLERDAEGELVWAWKPDTAPLHPREQRQLVELGRMTRAESPFRARDADTGRPVAAHSGTVAWNDHRERWIAILGAVRGDGSFLGEVYLAEAEDSQGPWVEARRIVTHDRYSFYNVAQRRFFDRDGGRVVYFEGTYTRTFSGTEEPTPFYDYNQIMYRLDLADPRLRAESSR